jgi:hypothetical protein
MKDELAISLRNDLWQRKLPELNGFSAMPGGHYRTDATAWAVMALSVAGATQDSLRSSRHHLAMSQMENGAVSLSPDHPDAIWPTSLAILSWKDSHEFINFLDMATGFLLKTTGQHFTRMPGIPTGHDPALKGWPWISDTYSWVEPTALAVIALRVSGYEKHERTQEAVIMLMDRQLSRGGWNYGNTTVFGKELNPMPETTGMALSALAGLVPESQVERSLNYLNNYIDHAKTPMSLGWGFLGLGSYGRRSGAAENKLPECLNRQGKYGLYDTAALSLVILALCADKGLVDFYKESHGIS